MSEPNPDLKVATIGDVKELLKQLEERLDKRLVELLTGNPIVPTAADTAQYDDDPELVEEFRRKQAEVPRWSVQQLMTTKEPANMSDFHLEVMRVTERHVAPALEAIGPQDLQSNCNDLTEAIKNELIQPRPRGLGLPQEVVNVIQGHWYGPCERAQKSCDHAWLRVQYRGEVLEFDPSYVQYLKERWTWERSVEVVRRYCIPERNFDVNERCHAQMKERSTVAGTVQAQGST